jgi:hypothetical protein
MRYRVSISNTLPRKTRRLHLPLTPLSALVAAPRRVSFLRQPHLSYINTAQTSIQNDNMTSKGNFELLFLENPLLDIQGVG